jgi:archaellum biogenesis protein FlaJ (TadC family)
MEATMEATTILVIVLAALFFGGMGTLVFISNRAPKDDSAPELKQQK